MSYNTGLEMILDIERELRAQQAARPRAVRSARRQERRHGLHAMRAAVSARLSHWARAVRPAVSPAGSMAPCCA